MKQLFDLGMSHFKFALGPANNDWRQRTSRLYYAAYTMVRAVKLEHDGHYVTDVSDHAKVADLPSSFKKRETYKNMLSSLRDDRNLADYDHTSTASDLVLGLAEAERLVTELVEDVKKHLVARKVAL